MADTCSVSELLLRWQELRAGGRDVSPDELCADCPDLLDELKRHIQALASMEHFLGPESGPGNPCAAPAAGLGETPPTRLEPDAPPAEAVLAAPEPSRLGDFRILRRLGAGGMGVVYLAEDTRLGRRVALKALRPELAAQEVYRRRFLREARAAAAVRSDHVVTVYHVGEDGGAPHLAMELLPGRSLDAWLRAGHRPGPAEVARIGRQAAEGLAAAHARGLVHRDVKPGNLWLEDVAGGWRVKVLDFGLARAAAEGPLTQASVVVGTPAYMAPEQAAGQAVDGRADLFSLGCVLYELCTGERPFAAADALAVLHRLATHTPAPLRQVNPAVPVALSDLVMQLLAKNPEDRPGSAQAVAEALQSIEDSRTLPPAAATQPPRRKRSLTIALAVLLAGVVTLGAVIAWRARHGTPAVRVAEPGGQVFVDGGEKVVVDSRKVGRMELAPGQHQLAVKRGADAIRPQPAEEGAWLKGVPALPAAKQVEEVAARLKKRNPGFDGKLTPTIEDGAVTALSLVTDHVTDLSPVRALTELRHLRCNGSNAEKGQLADLSPLREMKLTYLSCENTEVSDLSPLKGMPLTGLNCSATKVPDLATLKDMKLMALYCSHTTVSDLVPLKDMPLVTLNCSGTKVSDLEPLRGMSLRCLLCSATPVANLSPLKGMPLTQLACYGTRVSDLSPLKEVPLTILDCGNTPVADLLPLKGMPLTDLSCNGTKVSDLSPLWGMPLTSLRCGATQVSDLAALQGLPLAVLDCHATPVADLSPLKEMKLTHLRCDGTKVTDFSPLKGMKLRHLRCDFQPDRDAALLRSIPTLETINDKPAQFWKEVDTPRKP
jgi:Leucine-rich repeat (LRR) protein/tRNA A-37 threonylcarbamoyl transferase component Bud32